MSASPEPIRLQGPLPGPQPRETTAPPDGRAQPELDLRRRTLRLMAFRVGWVTVLLIAIVAIHALDATAAELDRPFLRFLFRVVVATYTLSLVYAAWLPRVKNLVRFASLQMIVDLWIASALVHATGGVASGFVLVYLLTIVGSAMICQRVLEVIATAAAATALYLGVSYLGYTGVLPVIAGSDVMPAAMPVRDVWRALVINVSALVGVTVLAANLVATARRAGERAAQATAYAEDAAALNQDIMRSLSTGLITTDLEGRILACNDGVGRMLGVEPQAVVGRPLEAMAPELAVALGRARAGSGAHQTELSVRGAGGEPLAISIVVAPLFDRRGTQQGSILHLEDRTVLRRMEAEAARNERLATVGRFAAGLAHEFRNPLAAISGSIELLRTDQQLAEEDKRLMGIVVNEVERLDRLVAGLLEYALPREPGTMPVDLSALARDVALMVEAELKGDPRAASIDIELDPGPVRGDPDQLRQVIWNLVRNAAEAIGEQGRICVSVRRTADRARSLIELRVSDNGSGIAPEEQKQVFEPFFSTKPRGTGLGLATVHQIVVAHGGTIGLESPSPAAGPGGGPGTTVWVRLPAA